MKYLLCNVKKLNLKNHYIWFHSVNENDVYFIDLFKPDNTDKTYYYM